jgi:phosphoribosyl 1,2-cyclic phosphodiesterase
MRFCVLGSGSKGNATFVEGGETRILIDAGFSGKELEKRLAAIGVAPDSLTAILITHEHTDHIRGAAILSRRFKLPIFANNATLAAGQPTLSKLHVFQEFSTGTTFNFGDIRVHPFRVSHDAADPVGFVVNDGTHTFGYCTDTGVVSRLMHHRLSACHGLVLECNHDPVMLKNGPYPLSLQQRVRSKTGHLANAEAAGFLSAILYLDLHHVVLSHISERNNHPEIAQAVVREVLAELKRESGGRELQLPEISVALQDKVGLLVDINKGR